MLKRRNKNIAFEEEPQENEISLNHCRSHITTYVNWLTRVAELSDTYQSWPVKGYDSGLIIERLNVPTTQEGAKDTRSLTTGADLRRRRSITKPNSDRVSRKYQSTKARTFDWPPEVKHQLDNTCNCRVMIDRQWFEKSEWI